jgi:hypothetical protein
MQIKEVSQNISPIKEQKNTLSSKDIEDYIVSIISNIDPRQLSKFEFYSVKNKISPLNDIINNLETLYKEKNLSNPENINNFTKIFSSIKLQLDLLDNLNSNKISLNELFVIISSVFISYLKKNVD